MLLVVAVGCTPAKPPVASLPPAEVSLAPPVVESVVDEYEATGRVAAKEYVELRPRVSGHLVEVAFQDGDEVKAGQLLFQIDPKPFDADLKQAQGEVQKYEAMLARNEAELGRQQELFKNNVVTKSELDLSTAERDVSKANLTASLAAVERKQLDVEYAAVKAPISGRASSAAIKVGNLVAPTTNNGSLLTTIVSVDPMQVYFSVDERTALKARQMKRLEDNVVDLKRIRELSLPVEIHLDDGKLPPVKGIIDFADNQVDKQTGTIQLRAEVDNKSRLLIDGMFVRVKLAISDRREALMVPARAIGTSLGTRYIFTVDDKNVAHMRSVQLGVRRGHLREVVPLEGESPLTVNDRVIIDGLQRVRDGDTVKPRENEPAKPAAAAPQA